MWWNIGVSLGNWQHIWLICGNTICVTYPWVCNRPEHILWSFECADQMRKPYFSMAHVETGKPRNDHSSSNTVLSHDTRWTLLIFLGSHSNTQAQISCTSTEDSCPCLTLIWPPVTHNSQLSTFHLHFIFLHCLRFVFNICHMVCLFTSCPRLGSYPPSRPIFVLCLGE